MPSVVRFRHLPGDSHAYRELGATYLLHRGDPARVGSRSSSGVTGGPRPKWTSHWTSPARIESLATRPAFASEASAAEQPVTAAYVSELKFDRSGEWRLAAVVKHGDTVEASLLPSIDVGDDSRIPDVGEAPPLIHKPTVADVGDVTEIETFGSRRRPQTVSMCGAHEMRHQTVEGERWPRAVFAGDRRSSPRSMKRA